MSHSLLLQSTNVGQTRDLVKPHQHFISTANFELIIDLMPMPFLVITSSKTSQTLSPYQQLPPILATTQPIILPYSSFYCSLHSICQSEQIISFDLIVQTSTGQTIEQQKIERYFVFQTHIETITEWKKKTKSSQYFFVVLFFLLSRRALKKFMSQRDKR